MCVAFSECRRNQFQCDNGVCMNDTLWCNGVSECLDGSDEPEDCQTTCSPNKLQCENAARCYRDDQVCDGELTCTGLSSRLFVEITQPSLRNKMKWC